MQSRLWSTLSKKKKKDSDQLPQQGPNMHIPGGFRIKAERAECY